VGNSSYVSFASTNLSGDLEGRVTPHKGSSMGSEISAPSHQFVSSISIGKKIIQELVIILR
jgi:hypothetical protein